MKELFDGEYAIPEGYTASIENGKIIVKKEESEDEKLKEQVVYAINQLHVCEYTKNKLIAWFEKQDTKVSVYRDTLFKIATVLSQYEDKDDSPLEKIRSIMIDGTICSMDLESKNKKQGEQKSINYTVEDIVEAVKDTSVLDKVEPKFKVGNWYLCVKNFFGKGVRFDKGHAYYCGLNGCLQEFDSGAHISIVEELYEYFSLWTIQDARDGDILANKDGAIFINAGSSNGRGTLDCYCLLSVQNKFCIEEHKTGSWLYKDEIKPATKEQSDLLFQKMHEAGYEWDAEKKELTKIEQNTAWSEEDENRFRNLIYLVEHSDEGSGTKRGFIEFINRLKSLKERYTWKPSEIQLQCLYDAIEHYQTNGYPASKLNELYEQMSNIYKL